MFASELQPVRSTAFEGPLELLVSLARAAEIDLRSIALVQIVRDFSGSEEVSKGAEFIGLLSSLLLLKAAALLPERELHVTAGPQDRDLRLDVLQQVIEYCHIRQVAEQLAEQAAESSGQFTRKAPPKPPKKISLAVSANELSERIEELIRRAGPPTLSLAAQPALWSVSEAMQHLRSAVAFDSQLLSKLFAPEVGRQALVILFLALLELIRGGEVRVVKDPGTAILSLRRTSERCTK